MQDWETDTLEAVNEALADFQIITYYKQTDGAPNDPNKPWLPGSASEQSFQVKGLVLPPKRKTLMSLAFMAGMEIPEGYDRGFLAGDCGFVPSLKDRFVDVNGTVYSVEWIDCLKPAGNPLLWFLGLKQ